LHTPLLWLRRRCYLFFLNHRSPFPLWVSGITSHSWRCSFQCLYPHVYDMTTSCNWSSFIAVKFLQVVRQRERSPKCFLWMNQAIANRVLHCRYTQVRIVYNRNSVDKSLLHQPITISGTQNMGQNAKIPLDCIWQLLFYCRNIDRHSLLIRSCVHIASDNVVARILCSMRMCIAAKIRQERVL
jgi:hypothetical protein